MHKSDSRLTLLSAPQRFGELLNGEKFVVPTVPELNFLTFVKLDCRRAYAINGDGWIRPSEKDAVTLVEAN